MKLKLETSTSFRALSKTVPIILVCFNIRKSSRSLRQSPTHTTIINWVHKIGYYELSREKPRADDWIVLMDHSIQMGSKKLFVMLGIRESDIDFNRPLQFKDLVPLRIISQEKSNGEIISNILNEVKNELGNIKYVVSDDGSDLKKAVRLSDIDHIHDLTHEIACILKRLYGKDSTYQSFREEITKMKQTLAQSQLAHLMPVAQRSKARFQNINIVADWSMKLFHYLSRKKNLHSREQSMLDWLKSYESFIQELSELNDVIKNVQQIIKRKGLSIITIAKCRKHLNKLKSKRGRCLRKKLLDYFNDIIHRLSGNTFLCTSDILESAFGKYKNYVSNNPMAGITNLALSISAFTSRLKEEEIIEACSTITINDIKKWTKELIGESLIKKRRKCLKKRYEVCLQ